MQLEILSSFHWPTVEAVRAALLDNGVHSLIEPVSEGRFDSISYANLWVCEQDLTKARKLAYACEFADKLGGTIDEMVFNEIRINPRDN